MKPAKLSFFTFFLVAGCFGATTTSIGSSQDDTSTEDGGDVDGGGSREDADSDGGGGDIDGGNGGGELPGSNKACSANPIQTAASCPNGEYCVATNRGTCGSGVCKAKPNAPPPSCPPAECGCDGVVRCGGHSASLGLDVGTKACTLPCGQLACDGVTQYCKHTTGGAPLADGGTAVNYYTCVALPAACESNRACSCLNSGSIVCTSDKDGKLRANELAP